MNKLEGLTGLTFHSAEREVERMEQQLDALRALLDEERQRCGIAKAEVAVLRSQVAEDAAYTADMRRQLEQAQAAIELGSVANDGAKAVMLDMLQQRDIARAEAAELWRQLEATQAEMASLRRQVAEAQATLYSPATGEGDA